MQIDIPAEQLEQLIEKTVSVAVSKIKPDRVPPIMSKKQVAAYLDKPISTIDRWMREGLPFRKEGKDYPEFYKPHVDKWISERFGAIESEVVQ
jgi:hypothetical protein